MSFPAYPNMTESGIEWVGDVPSHWVRQPLFALVAERDESNKGMIENNLLSLSYGRIVRKDIDNNDGLLPASFETYQIIEPNDIVWRLTDLQNDKRSLRTAIARERGIITSAYLVTQPRRIAPDYLSYLLRAYDLAKVFYSMGGGLRQSMKFADVKWLPVMLPRAAEQVVISAFLDRETAKINALIEEQRRLITLLKEKRQAVISYAVTKGLDPHAPMKDSGIEWLGEVPAHWTVAPLKRMAAVVAGYAFAAHAFSEDSDNWRLLRGINLSASGIRWNEDTVYWERSENDGLSAWELRAGDVVLGMDRPWIGDGLRVAKITEEDLPCMLLQRVAAVRADCSSVQRFILHCLRHEAFFHHCAPEMTGVSVPHISGGQIEDFRVPLPPTKEMDAISWHIENRSAEFAALIGAAQSAIELLGERRAALISAAVTGKIDVRGSAKVLPFPIDRALARGLIATEIIERSAHQATFGRVKFQKIAFLAEAHVGISELAGSYTREAAGPLDRALIADMESGAHRLAGIERDQPGGSGTANSYRLGPQRGAHHQDLSDWLGADRTGKLDMLIAGFADLSTRDAEAVATLYGVWNDVLSEGASPTDDEIITGFLNDWHPEKRKKFRASDLPEWLGWMRRHGIVPNGSGPKSARQIGALL